MVFFLMYSYGFLPVSVCVHVSACVSYTLSLFYFFLFLCFVLFFLKRERRCGVGWVGRIFEEAKEGKP